MRLTHLKIAGFKSFADSTTIHLHGQRVGIVGPNGCGKSNVMESVRWVLGESSAKEMRADAMDAVIFNGSANRKPISRSSVELLFDNEANQSINADAWSQYAQISVKRVIEREKGSTYYINNTAVRRRDVADLFLGTGLGGRAYAIIGQNTISRIVEAKPEELRVFLEEAAGISKYKERRRETASRLQDTRQNLIRVEDICRELQQQILKLEFQAEITKQYHALQAAYKLAEGQLWLIKKRDAEREWNLAQMQVDKQIIALEAHMAALRKCEAELEQYRQDHYAASEAINIAQAAYYESNAEVSNLEAQVKQSVESRDRYNLQLQQINDSLEHNINNLHVMQLALAAEVAALKIAAQAEQQAELNLQALKRCLPEKQALLNATNIAVQKSLQALNEANNKIQIEHSNINFINKNIQDFQERISNIKSELSSLNIPSDAELIIAKTPLDKTLADIASKKQLMQKLRENEGSLQLEITQLRTTQNAAQRALHLAEAEVQSLLKIQQSLNASGKLDDWLQSKQLEHNTRLWQEIQIDEVWSVALEAVLGEKLNALILDDSNDLNEKEIGLQNVLPIDHRPPGALVIGYATTTFNAVHEYKSQLIPLITVINNCSDQIKPILADWLEGVYLLASSDALQMALKQLQPGERLVNIKGDIFSRHSVAYHGDNSSLSGVLERQRQLQILQKALPQLLNELELNNDLLKQAETKQQQNQQQQQFDENQLRIAMQSQHQLQLAYSKLQQAQLVALNREKTILVDLQVLSHKLEKISLEKTQKQSDQNTLTSLIVYLKEANNNDLNANKHAEKHYSEAQNAVQVADKLYQEAMFNKKIIMIRIKDIEEKINVINKDYEIFTKNKSEIEQALTLIFIDRLKSDLIQLINTKHLREATLATARNHLATQELLLQDLSRLRMQNEQQSHPLRNNLEQSRLNAQQARLHLEQCQLALLENGMEEQTLTLNLNEKLKASDLMRKTTQIQQDIAALGAVNLAAIQELAKEVERKSYLDSQMLDLRQATDTLEEAILKIDRETRDKLMHTFHTVNMHFNELFGTLFAGGQARLELLGNEILDTGIQVFAQPPGKKNTTIQLLSGGEKALTAIALVFALFRLNPAPFCLMDEVDAPLDDSNTERFCKLVKKMSDKTQFLFVSHNKVTMEMAQQLIGVTMQESGVSRIVDVDIDAAISALILSE